jgi:hypothetical protein
LSAPLAIFALEDTMQKITFALAISALLLAWLALTSRQTEVVSIDDRVLDPAPRAPLAI